MAKAKLKRKITQPRLKGNVRRKNAASTPKLRGRNLEQAVEQFQAEPDEKKAHERWKQIEASVFDVQFED